MVSLEEGGGMGGREKGGGRTIADWVLDGTGLDERSCFRSGFAREGEGD